MLRAFYSSASGMRAQEMLIDNTANNLANVNTTAFKKSNINFSDLIYDIRREPGAVTGQGQNAPIGLQIGNGTRAVGTTNVFTQGVANETGSDTHMSIEGDGFFQVLTPAGVTRYTRDGSFNRNRDGLLVTGDGLILDPPITIPPEVNEFSISSQGVVSYMNGDTNTEIGQVQLFRFANPSGLKNLGGNLYQTTTAAGDPIPGFAGDLGFGTIRQGSLEGSNVEVVSELVNLITAQRAYEINSRAIRAGDEMLSTTGQLVR